MKIIDEGLILLALTINTFAQSESDDWTVVDEDRQQHVVYEKSMEDRDDDEMTGISHSFKSEEGLCEKCKERNQKERLLCSEISKDSTYKLPSQTSIDLSDAERGEILSVKTLRRRTPNLIILADEMTGILVDGKVDKNEYKYVKSYTEQKILEVCETLDEFIEDRNQKERQKSFQEFKNNVYLYANYFISITCLGLIGCFGFLSIL